ncbi:hypothetical protein BT96DRAFT_1103982 [Gymnopus androsaceus JB14]|uniref:Uncharacterized protein n=1 Tax=Gymnopus androsaceus JB14 TaxID=1447944 RepID=A0A6A4GEP4_9AGAR|nr:hypothetical protein BT96DRAFT_1103982 [Gymnopus androsaceus JB14]
MQWACSSVRKGVWEKSSFLPVLNAVAVVAGATIRKNERKKEKAPRSGGTTQWACGSKKEGVWGNIVPSTHHVQWPPQGQRPEMITSEPVQEYDHMLLRGAGPGAATVRDPLPYAAARALACGAG